MTPGEARALYPVLRTRAYLNAGTCGPLAEATVEALRRGEADDLEHGRSGGDRIDRYYGLAARARAGIGRTAGAAPEQVALTASTTEGCNIALAAIGIAAGDEVVTTDNEHPGLTAPLAARRADLRVAEVLHHPASEALERILACVTPKTRLIALSHVGWLNGQVLPVGEVKRATGLPVLVDGAQSGGAIPVAATAVDFYTVSCQKWLCGPEATGGLVITEPDRWEPVVAGFPATNREGAERFQVVHPSLPTLEALVTAIELHPDWRFERAAALTAVARERLAARYEVASEPDQGTLVSFVAPGDPKAVVSALGERDVVVRDLPGTPWIRVSCGYWNDESDIDRLLSALSDPAN